MLPPTLTPPTPSPSTPNPPTPKPSTAGFNRSGTYGDLIARATASVEAAQRISGQPFTDASTAHAELLGYERFLHVAGIHLQLLTGLARTPSAPLRKLAGHLTGATRG